VGPNSWFITRFDCHAAVCLPDKIFVKSRSNWYSLDWSGAELYHTAVNEWRKRLLACVRIVGKRFKQFYYRQLENGQLDEMSTIVSKM